MYFIIAALTFFSAFAFAGSSESAKTASVKEGSACHKTVAKVAKSWGKFAASTLGRIDKCDKLDGEITPEEIQSLSCKKDITVDASNLSHLQSFVRGEWAEEGIFQIVAKRSEEQLQCRNSTFTAYETQSELKTVINNSAKQKFDSQLEELHALVFYRAKLVSELKELDLAATDRGLGAATIKGRAEYRSKIADLSKVIVARVAALPLAYEPEIAKAYVEMAASGSFNEKVFAQSMAAAQKKYQAALNYYTTHKHPLGNGNVLFCLDEDFRTKAYKSHGVANTLAAVYGQTGENNFRNKLNCRLNATYGKGADRWWYAKNGALLAGYVFAAPEMLATYGMEGLLELRGLQTLSAMATTEAAVASVQTLFLATALSQIHEGCFQEKFDVSTSGSSTCDPYKDFQKSSNTVNPAKCAIALGFNGGFYGKMAYGLLKEARAAVAAGKFVRGTITPAK